MLFLATGGTIDKQPVYLPDGTFDNDSKIFTETQLPQMLEKAQFVGEAVFHTLFMLDSLDMTDEHRVQIVSAINQSEEEKVVITHGTDTMPDTARFLIRNGLAASRTIVLTGSMVPFSVGEDKTSVQASDAVDNIVTALESADTYTSGVYVAMNGDAFAGDNVRKNYELGLFEAIR